MRSSKSINAINEITKLPFYLFYLLLKFLLLLLLLLSNCCFGHKYREVLIWHILHRLVSELCTTIS